MDLELDDQQVALAESVRTVLAREWPPAAVRRLVEDGTGAEALWERLVDLDWSALCVAEEDGGMGYGPVEAALVLEGCGAAAVAGPLLPTIGLFAPLVRQLGSPDQRARLLGEVAGGTCTGTAAVAELTRKGTGAAVDVGALTVAARPDGTGWRLRGTVRSVVEAGRVDRIVVPAALDGDEEMAAFLLGPAAGVEIAPVRAVDPTRQLATVHLDDVAVGADAVLGQPGEPAAAAAVRRALDETITMVAAELVGTCSTIFEWTLAHVKDREQFGVRIGSFQAVKHRLADAYLALEAARAAVLVAAVAIAEDDPRRTVAASTAKSLSGDCADLVAKEGIQLLGGIGFTWEHDMHLFVKRALASSALAGGAEAHRQRVADLIGLVPNRP